MFYYQYQGRCLASLEEALPFEKKESCGAGEVIFLFRRTPLAGRDSFAVTDCGLFTAEEGPETLTPTAPVAVDEGLAKAVEEGRVRAVNYAHPRWEELLAPMEMGKKRVHILALGDVGSTMLTALRLIGGDVISTIGICDVREEVTARWEFEMEQVAYPWEYDKLPKVEVVSQDDLFHCDVFLFCASRFVPDTAVKSGDVRMAQYALNRELVAMYAKRAREANYKGLFCVVSDPVDQLCRAALVASNKNDAGETDFMGLFTRQVRGFGLGVMNARAAYYAKRDERFAAFLTEGRAYGPHGQGLIIANSVENYDNALSLELTDLTQNANLAMRRLGFKPYVAPALSSAAISVVLLLKGEWHYSSSYLGGIFMGGKNRFGGEVEIERLALPEALMKRIRETMAYLASIEP